MSDLIQQAEAPNQAMSITLAEPPELEKPPRSNFPALSSILRNSDTASLAATIERIVDIYPHVYTLALSGARCQDPFAQEQLDALENVLGTMRKAFDDRDFDWISFSQLLTEFFDKLVCNCNPAMITPAVEYALGRVLLFRSLCDECHHNGIGKVVGTLQSLHVASMEQQELDGALLLELFTQWRGEFKSDFVVDALLPEYSKLLEHRALLKSRIHLETEWLKHFKNDSWCDHFDEDCKLFRTIAKVIKTFGLSDRLKSWLDGELYGYSDYYEAIELLHYCGRVKEAEYTLNQAAKKLSELDASRLLSCIAERMAAEDDLTGAAEKMFTAFVNNPSLHFFEEFKLFVDNHLTSEWHIWEPRLLEFIGRELDIMAAQSPRPDEFIVLNSVLISLLMADKNIEASWDRAKLGCKWKILQSLMHETGKLPYGKIKDTICSQLETELEGAGDGYLMRAEQLLLVLFRSLSGSQEKREFHQYLKMLKDKFNLRGKSASILRKVGF